MKSICCKIKETKSQKMQLEREKYENVQREKCENVQRKEQRLKLIQEKKQEMFLHLVIPFTEAQMKYG